MLNEWSLRRRLSLTFVVVGLLVSAGTLLAAGGLARLNSAQHRQVDRLDPAIRTSTDLFISLLNQETGLRGYALTRDPDFLQPYRKGVTDTNAGARQLQDQVAREPVLRADADALIAQGRTWQNTYAISTLNAIEHTPRQILPVVPLARGKALFDKIRVRYDTLNNSFGVARRQARQQLSTSTALLVVLVAAATVLSVLVSLGFWIALRQWITRPLAKLGAEVRTVAAGDLEHPVATGGPPDIVRLGVDAELMRKRLIRDYRAAVEARGAAQASALQVSQQAVELRRSNAELEQFAYVASHDLQEPLRKVASFCQMLDKRYTGQLDDRADQYIAFAVDGAKRMQVLINDLLAFSRVGRSTAGFRPVPLHDVVAGAISDLERRLTETGGSVEVGELPTLPGDQSLLRQLFINLIGNAVKFRGAAAPVVRISAERTADVWTFTVADNGIGIDPRYAEKVFAIFARLHARDQYEGTGIGLALCRKIVEFHSGTIHVAPPEADQSRGGATIIFTLPISTPAQSPPSVPSVQLVGATPSVPPAGES